MSSAIFPTILCTKSLNDHVDSGDSQVCIVRQLNGPFSQFEQLYFNTPLKKIFIGVELIYSVVLISAAQQNESVILINTKHSLLTQTQTSKRLAIHFIIITIIVLRELKRERTKKTRQELFGKRPQKFTEMRDLVT